MSVVHHEIQISGEAVAQVISLGQRVVLYTTCPELRSLDDKIFETLADARGAVYEKAAEGATTRPAAA